MLCSKLSILCLGDSYTIGEAVQANENFPNQLSRLLIDKGVKVSSLEIIATTGWTTSSLIEKIISRSDLLNNRYDLVTLLIGVNNQYQNLPIEIYIKEFEELLMRSIEFVSGKASQVFVLSIPDYSYTPFGQSKDPFKISSEIDIYNQINRSIAERYSVNYLNITDYTRGGLNDPLLVASDDLHPSSKLYAIVAKELFTLIRKS